MLLQATVPESDPTQSMSFFLLNAFCSHSPQFQSLLHIETCIASPLSVSPTGELANEKRIAFQGDKFYRVVPANDKTKSPKDFNEIYISCVCLQKYLLFRVIREYERNFLFLILKVGILFWFNKDFLGMSVE
jgi:hypothetical protein